MKRIRITKYHAGWCNHHQKNLFLNNFVFRTVLIMCALCIIKICNNQRNQEHDIKNCKIKRGKSCVYYETSCSTTKAKLTECYLLTCGRVEMNPKHLKDGEVAVVSGESRVLDCPASQVQTAIVYTHEHSQLHTSMYYVCTVEHIWAWCVTISTSLICKCRSFIPCVH